MENIIKYRKKKVLWRKEKEGSKKNSFSFSKKESHELI